MRCRPVLALGILALVTACASSSAPPPTPTPDLLAYDADPSAIVILAHAQIRPGGPRLGEDCNDIPALSIWGDGRVVYVDFRGGRREVKTGSIGADGVRATLAFLRDQGFYARRTPVLPAPSGTGYSVRVNLKAGTFGTYEYLAIDNRTTMYGKLLRSIDQSKLSPLVPEKALLVTGPYYHYVYIPPNDPIPEWPARFGFSLAEGEKGRGRWVTGEALAFLWQTINERYYSAGFREGDRRYAVALEIPGISADDLARRCWQRSVATPTAYPYPPPPRPGAPTLAAPPSRPSPVTAAPAVSSPRPTATPAQRRVRRTRSDVISLGSEPNREEATWSTESWAGPA